MSGGGLIFHRPASNVLAPKPMSDCYLQVLVATATQSSCRPSFYRQQERAIMLLRRAQGMGVTAADADIKTQRPFAAFGNNCGYRRF